MTANKRLDVWMASTTVERNALGFTAGVTVGDFCLVDGTNLYVATTVLAASSTWRPLAGLPTTGPIGLGGKNSADAMNRSVFMLSAVTFRALLDVTPSSMTLASLSNVNWPLLPTMLLFNNTGFTYHGTSNVVAPTINAWMRGTYTIAY